MSLVPASTAGVNEPGTPRASPARRWHSGRMRYEFSFDEILSEHAYDRPLTVDGVRCHGGFVDGRYVSPRTLVRSEAIAAWQSRLPAGEVAAVLDPITACIPPFFPNDAQTRLLVREG